jgi:hypothetical protein
MKIALLQGAGLKSGEGNKAICYGDLAAFQVSLLRHAHAENQP